MSQELPSPVGPTNPTDLGAECVACPSSPLTHETSVVLFEVVPAMPWHVQPWAGRATPVIPVEYAETSGAGRRPAATKPRNNEVVRLMTRSSTRSHQESPTRLHRPSSTPSP